MVRQRSAKPSFGSSNLPITSTSEQAPYGSEKPVAFGGWFFFNCTPLLLLSPRDPLRWARAGAPKQSPALLRKPCRFGGRVFFDCTPLLLLFRIEPAALGFDSGRKAPETAHFSANRLFGKVASSGFLFLRFFPDPDRLSPWEGDFSALPQLPEIRAETPG